MAAVPNRISDKEALALAHRSFKRAGFVPQSSPSAIVSGGARVVGRCMWGTTCGTEDNELGECRMKRCPHFTAIPKPAPDQLSDTEYVKQLGAKLGL